MCSTWLGLTAKRYIRLERLTRDKHSSLFVAKEKGFKTLNFEYSLRFYLKCFNEELTYQLKDFNSNCKVVSCIAVFKTIDITIDITQ